MKEFFRELFLYNTEMNQKLIKIYSDNPDKISEKALKLMSHILNAHQIWNNRIDKQGESYDVMQIHPLNTFEGIDYSNYTKTVALIDICDFEKMVSYTNTRGKTYKNSVKDILFHIINHSNYHRAQIATAFKETGIEPIVSDYIFYKR
jgi:uncharacterized damage-inducible protein DinB